MPREVISKNCLKRLFGIVSRNKRISLILPCPSFPGFFWFTKENLKFYQGFSLLAEHTQRKTKGRQLGGKIVSALFHPFWHFSTHFHTFFQSFSEFFLRDFFVELRGFTTVLAQRHKKGIKESKKKKTKPFCTLVVARLSSLPNTQKTWKKQRKN